MATRQHGVVTRAQLSALGITPAEIRGRVARGALIRVHRGVFRAGHLAPNLESTYLAAVLACGSGALLAGLAAAHLLALVKGRPPAPEVLVPERRRLAGVLTRRTRTIDSDRTSWRGIPVTTTPRTLVDLAGVLSPEALARACHEAGVLHRTTPAQVESVLARRPNSPGAANLRRVLRGEVDVTLSPLERRFVALLREAGLPLPITNKPADGRRVDCRWPAQCLTVELDSYRYHSSRHAWELDRRREREARARGDEFRRYTHADVFEDPRVMLEDMGRLLSASA